MVSVVDAGQAEEVLLSFMESPSFIQASTNASRLVSRLKCDVQSKQLYLVHQDLRNIYFRFSNRKEKIEPLNTLLYHGAMYLLSSNEIITGQDIALLLLEISSKLLQNLHDSGDRRKFEDELSDPRMKYHIDNKTVSLSICQQVTSIAVKLPDNELGKPKFIAETLKILTPKILNRDLLHHSLADSFWRHRDYVNARYHFLNCATVDNAEDIGNMLVEYHGMRANKNEVDLFISQFIFQLLCLQSPIDVPRAPCKQESANSCVFAISRKTRSTIKSIAAKIFSTYTLKHPLLNQVEVPFSSLPLLNFTYFTISILNSGHQEADVFKVLNSIYKTTINRDPDFQTYLTRIGTIYFGIVDRQKQQQQQGGFFNNILMSLLEGTDEDDDDDYDDDECNRSNNMSLCDELD